jgi:hypothetical protein
VATCSAAANPRVALAAPRGIVVRRRFPGRSLQFALLDSLSESHRF